MNEHALTESEISTVQYRVFFSMVILYSFYFTANYNLGPTAKSIQEEFLISDTKFSIIFSIFFLFFALGQFVSGYLADRYSPKRIMIIGAIGGAFANLLFSLSNEYSYFVAFWALNAIFLSMGWSSGCCILFNWFPIQLRGRLMGVFNAFSFLGGVIIYPILGYSIPRFGWRSAFIIPALLLILWTLVFNNYVQDEPILLGCESQWQIYEDVPKKKIGFRHYVSVIKHPAMNIVYLAAICSQFVRWGLLSWIVKILIEPVSKGGYGLSLLYATMIASSIHWGGVFFSIILGYISDVMLRGSRWQVIFSGFVITAGILLIIHYNGHLLLSNKIGVWLFAALLFIAGGCIQGLQAPMFNIPGDILSRHLRGIGVGITNGWSYLGTSLSGIFLGRYLFIYGFRAVFLLMAIISLFGAGFTLLYRRIQQNERHQK